MPGPPLFRRRSRTDGLLPAPVRRCLGPVPTGRPRAAPLPAQGPLRRWVNGTLAGMHPRARRSQPVFGFRACARGRPQRVRSAPPPATTPEGPGPGRPARRGTATPPAAGAAVGDGGDRVDADDPAGLPPQPGHRGHGLLGARLRPAPGRDEPRYRGRSAGRAVEHGRRPGVVLLTTRRAATSRWTGSWPRRAPAKAQTRFALADRRTRLNGPLSTWRSPRCRRGAPGCGRRQPGRAS